jgi:hypothetical protein
MSSKVDARVTNYVFTPLALFCRSRSVPFRVQATYPPLVPDGPLPGAGAPFARGFVPGVDSRHILEFLLSAT